MVGFVSNGFKPVDHQLGIFPLVNCEGCSDGIFNVVKYDFTDSSQPL